MKQVWKCDYCSDTSLNSDKILKHEPMCYWNPINKNCHTCEYSFEDGYEGCHDPGCEINLDAKKGERIGNCEGWKSNNTEYLRKLKLEKICKNLAKS